MTDRDTVKVPPMTTNPTIAKERRRDRYAVYVAAPNIFCGIEIDEGFARRITPMLDEETSRRWLGEARSAAYHDTVFPSFCKRNHLKLTPGICAECLGARP